MAKDRTSASVATKLATLLVAHESYDSRWEIVGVHPTDHGGHQLVVLEALSQQEYVITVQQRSTAPAIVASVEKKAERDTALFTTFEEEPPF